MKTDDTPVGLNEVRPQKVKVDVKEIEKFTNEGDFMFLAVELLKEVSITTSILSCTIPFDDKLKPRKWNRNEAVLVGHMVRLAKLQSGFLDQVCQNRREIADILYRPLMETLINVHFLLMQNSVASFKEYIEYSLRTEKQLLQEVEANIAKRGSELPIETRIKNSIKRAFATSGMKPDEVNEKNTKAWGGSIYKRAKNFDVNGVDAYRAMVSLPNHATHGNWQDLITHHLEYEDGEFMPKPEWNHCRPQPVFVVALLSVKVNLAYLEKVIPDYHEKKEIEASLKDMLVRLHVADELHEQFLQKRQKNKKQS